MTVLNSYPLTKVSYYPISNLKLNKYTQVTSRCLIQSEVTESNRNVAILSLKEHLDCIAARYRTTDDTLNCRLAAKTEDVCEVLVWAPHFLSKL